MSSTVVFYTVTFMFTSLIICKNFKSLIFRMRIRRLWCVLRFRKVPRLMFRLREAVLNEDWPSVGRIIGNIF